jgi:hypothetical protein
MISLGRVLKIAPFAALIGSTVGTAAYVIYEPLRYHYLYPPRHDALPIFWLFTLFSTLPGAVVVGIPAIYPARNIISRHPIASLVPTVPFAVGLSFLLLGWAFKIPGTSEYRDLDLLFIFSGSTALGFVVMLAFLGRRDRTGHPAS